MQDLHREQHREQNLQHSHRTTSHRETCRSDMDASIIGMGMVLIIILSLILKGFIKSRKHNEKN